MILPFALALAFLLALLYNHLTHPLRSLPGPPLHALSKYRLALSDLLGTRTRSILSLHASYGPVVRIGPNEVHFNSLSALRTIYGAGSGFERTRFYAMFDVYGRKNLFTFEGVEGHAGRKRLVANAYSKSVVMRGEVKRMIEGKIRGFLELVERQGRGDADETGAQTAKSVGEGKAVEIFSALHYYAIDAITAFLYGKEGFGATGAMKGVQEHRDLLDDIIDPARRRLSWFAVHLPGLTKWLYTRTGALGKVVEPLLPMQKPSTYTGIRIHAMKAMESYRDATPTQRKGSEESIIARLWTTKEKSNLDDLDIASECADHLLAGIDTTSDTLMFLIWALSRPENAAIQERLIQECQALPYAQVHSGVVGLEAADNMPFFNAILKETLRLYAPLPASEPRSSPVDTIIDGYKIPQGTVCVMDPFSLHRNEQVFPDSLKWDPYRWMRDDDDPVLAEMKRWWWPFSSGARMCIGMHLAIAEMSLVPTIYRQYSTRIKPGFEDIAPGITSRFEVFTDDTFARMKEHTCWIEFVPRAG